MRIYTHKWSAFEWPENVAPLKPREVAKLLRADGWYVKRKGPGDHVQYAHPSKPGKMTLDMGADPIPTGTLRSIYNQAGWEW